MPGLIGAGRGRQAGGYRLQPAFRAAVRAGPAADLARAPTEPPRRAERDRRRWEARPRLRTRRVRPPRRGERPVGGTLALAFPPRLT
jgi:hypothetical protein